MPDDALDITIDADEKPAVTALGRVNAALKETGNVAVSVGRATVNAFEAITKSTVRMVEAGAALAVMYKGYTALRTAMVGTTASAVEQTSAMQGLVNVYRAARLALAPSLFTGITLAAGVAIEELERLSYRYGKLVEQIAYTSIVNELGGGTTAGRLRAGFQVTQELRGLGRQTGRGDAFFVNAVNDLAENIDTRAGKRALGYLGLGTLDLDKTEYTEILTSIGTAFDQVIDPIRRAQLAFALFGSETGDKILPLLNRRLEENIKTLNDWGAILSREEATGIAIFKRNVDELKESIASLTVGFSAAMQGAKNFLAVSGARLGNAAFVAGNIGVPLILRQGQPDYLQNLTPGMLLSALHPEKGVQVPEGFDVFEDVRRSLIRQQAALAIGAEAQTGLRRFRQTRAGAEAELARQRSAGEEAGRILEDVATGRRALSVDEIQFYSSEFLSAQQLAKLAHSTVTGFEIQRKRQEAGRISGEGALQAQGRSFGPAAGLLFNASREGFRFATDVDQEGNLRNIGLTYETRQNLEKTLQANALQYARETVKETSHLYREQFIERLSYETRLFQEQRSHVEETGKLAIENFEKEFAKQDYFATRRKDTELRGLELGQAGSFPTSRRETLAQELYVADAKLGIEQEYIQRSAVLQIEKIAREQERELQAARDLGELKVSLGIITQEQLDDRLSEIHQRFAQDAAKINQSYEGDLAAARENAAIQSSRAVKDYYRQTFDQLKDSAGHVFDALLTRSQSVFSAIGNMFRVAILTPIREAVSAWTASLLTPLFTGMRPGQGPSGSGVPGLAGVGLGALGLGGTATVNAQFAPLGSVADIVGGPGGTSGFAGPVGSIPGLPSAGTFGGLSSATLAGRLAGLRGLFYNPGSIQLGPGLATTAAGIGGPLGTLAGIASSPAALIGGPLLAVQGVQRGGILGATQSTLGGALGGFAAGSQIGSIGGVGGGLIGAGAGLFASGLQRGGLSGIGMTTAGGAVAGFGIAGPVGALIGAGVGFFAGVVRSFIETAAEKLRDKIRDVYGVTIYDKGILQQLLAQAKQSYGGNIDVAIRSPQMREFIELYAVTTGQRIAPANISRPSSLIEMGGGLFQQPTYIYGRSYGNSGSIPTFGGAGGGTVIVNYSMSREDAERVMSGQVVSVMQSNARMVTSLNMDNMRSSFGRRESAALQISPSTVIS